MRRCRPPVDAPTSRSTRRRRRRRSSAIGLESPVAVYGSAVRAGFKHQTKSVPGPSGGSRPPPGHGARARSPVIQLASRLASSGLSQQLDEAEVNDRARDDPRARIAGSKMNDRECVRASE